jgi:hypothetical protein
MVELMIATVSLTKLAPVWVSSKNKKKIIYTKYLTQPVILPRRAA